jgi:release factor glutamine methyltransferase
VPEPEREHLQAEVARFEPTVALFGGRSGFDLIAQLLRDAPAHLAPGGLLVFEFGYGQEQDVLDAAVAAGWDVAGIAHDYQDIPRVAAFRRSRG